MIDHFAELVSFIGNNLIQGIFISILFIIIIKALLKDRIETQLPVQIIRWTIILYACFTLISTLLLLFFYHSEKYALLNRAAGPYWWAFFLLFSFNAVVPLVLLNNKIGKRVIILLVVSLFMNVGWIFESFVVHLTNLYEDYTSNDYNPYLPNNREIQILFKGLLIGVAALIIGNGLQQWKTKKAAK